MAGISIGGLASGLDTEAMIEGLMRIERAPQARLELRQGRAKAREDALRDISSKLQAASQAAVALRSATLWADVQNVESSNPNAVAARLVAGAGPGGYELEVSQLARAEQRTFDYAPPGSASKITVNGVDVSLEAGATLADAAAAINADKTTGVFAVASGGRLVLSSRETGAANSIAASGSAIVEDASKLKAGLDAVFKIDGVASTSSSNVLTDAITGLELTLKSVTTSPVTVNVGNPAPDDEAIVAKVKAFVTAYNAAVDAIRSRLTEPTVPNPSTKADANKGVLFGDSQLGDLRSRLRQFVDEADMSAMGISTGAPSAAVSASSDSVVGRLVFDEAKLKAALEADPAGVREQLAGSNGFSSAFEGFLAPALGTTGTISDRLGAASAEGKRIGETMSALDVRLQRREDRLRAQFAALESALSRSKSQSEWLNGQLLALSK